MGRRITVARSREEYLARKKLSTGVVLKRLRRATTPWMDHAERSGVIIFVTGSPARAHVPGVTAIGAAFGAIETLTENLAFEVGQFGVRVVCLRTFANADSRSIQDTMGFQVSQLNITREQAMAQIVQYNFLKVPATVGDTANAAVLIASDRASMLTATVVNATAAAALD